MGLSRRFLNLIVDNRIQGAKSLCSIDLRRHKLFNTTTPAPKGNALALNKIRLPSPSLSKRTSDSDLKDQRLHFFQAADRRVDAMESPLPAQSINLGASAMGYSTETCVRKQAAASVTRTIRTIELPQPVMNFRCSIVDCYWYLKCLPLSDRKLLCVDPYARTALFDLGLRQVEAIPYLHVPKHSPLPCFVPLPSSSDATEDGNGSFYILEGSPYQELQGDDDTRQQLSNQFEAFVYHSESKSWQRQLLPPPPFVCDPKHYKHRGPDITSYAVVERGGSHVIFVSVDGAGTYSLDTVTHTWSHVGDWVLPFTGKVEYVPELKLWFGICAQDWQLGAAELSTMDSQPQLIGTWKELKAPGDWRQLKPPQLVNLGSGRFCITRFFFRGLLHPMAFSDSEYDDPVDEEYFTVLTGIDVVPCVHDAHGTASDTFSGGNGSKGKVQLQMIKHNSRRHISYGSVGNIEVVF